MIYLKKFSAESDYKAYRDDTGGGYIQPNVSLCDDNKKVYYNLNANGHSYVDLGLPSGTLWATMNVGASKPSDAGLYFQWGDTKGYTANQVGTGDGKKKFAEDWSDYKWGTYPNFSKYTTIGAKLDLEDDAAHVHMGGDWRMPTFEDLEELLTGTTTAWTTSDNVSGVTFTSKKDGSKSIFIPTAGYANDGSVRGSGNTGEIWASIIRYNSIIAGENLFIFPGNAELHYAPFTRQKGASVRGVIG